MALTLKSDVIRKIEYAIIISRKNKINDENTIGVGEYKKSKCYQ